jgi:hypothetical protein
MDEFQLAVRYDGREISFPAKLLLMGYTHKIEVDIDGVKVIFEPDEERNYRALVNQSAVNTVNIGLLQAIAHKLNELLT